MNTIHSHCSLYEAEMIYGRPALCYLKQNSVITQYLGIKEHILDTGESFCKIHHLCFH